jgi:hypothetical protein
MKNIIKLINKKEIYFPLFQSSHISKKNKRKNILIVVSYVTGAFFYLLSLHNLNESNMQCFNQTGAECYYILCILAFIASCFTVISLYLILFFGFKKLHLAIIVIIYFIFYFIGFFILFFYCFFVILI